MSIFSNKEPIRYFSPREETSILSSFCETCLFAQSDTTETVSIGIKQFSSCFFPTLSESSSTSVDFDLANSSEKVVRITVSSNTIKNEKESTADTVKQKNESISSSKCNSNLIVASQEVSKEHPCECTCVDCLYFDVYRKNKRNTDNGEPHAQDCICLECMCTTPKGSLARFYIREPTKKSEDKPHNAQCACIECLFKPPLVQNCIPNYECGDTQKMHGGNCRCPDCATINTSAKQSRNHSLSCECLDCILYNHPRISLDENSKLGDSLCSESPSCSCLECVVNIDAKHHSGCSCMRCLFEKPPQIEKMNIIEIPSSELEARSKETEDICNENRREKQIEELEDYSESETTKCANSMTENVKYESILHESYFNRRDIFGKEENLKMNVEITEIRRISSDKLLLLWAAENLPRRAKGYEIFVNGYIRSRIYSIERTCAVLHDLDFSSDDLFLEIYVVMPDGLYESPAKAIIEV